MAESRTTKYEMSEKKAGAGLKLLIGTSDRKTIKKLVHELQRSI